MYNIFCSAVHNNARDFVIPFTLPAILNIYWCEFDIIRASPDIYVARINIQGPITMNVNNPYV